MYDYYYSSADCQIYFSNVDGSRLIKVDKAIAIAYSVNQTSTPIFGLNSREAAYFSEGNTICQGSILISFVDEEYLKIILKHVFKEDDDLKEVTALDGGLRSVSDANIQSLSNTAFINLSATTKKNAENLNRILSIGSIKENFNIKLVFNNENAFKNDSTKIITLEDVKLTQDSLQVSSGQDSHISNSYGFIFKTIKRG